MKRRLTLAVLIGLVLSASTPTVEVEGSHGTTGDSTTDPDIDITPTCAAPGVPSDTWTIIIQGQNWEADDGNNPITFTLDDGDSATTDFTESMLGTDQPWTFEFNPPQQPHGSRTYHVVATQTTGSLDYRVPEPFIVPCSYEPTIEVGPTCARGWDGSGVHSIGFRFGGSRLIAHGSDISIGISGEGWHADWGPIEFFFEDSDGNEAGPVSPASTPAQESWSQTVSVPRPAVDEGEFVIRVVQEEGPGLLGIESVERLFAVRGETTDECPTGFAIDPSCGFSGEEFVVRVSGSGFPGASVWVAFEPENVVDALNQPGHEIDGQTVNLSGGAFSEDFFINGPVPDGEYAVRVYTKPASVDTGGVYIT